MTDFLSSRSSIYYYVNPDLIAEPMTLKITDHARREAFADRISVADIEEVLRSGEVVRLYAEDRPYPSRLVLGFVEGNPIHVVAADVPGTGQIIVITTYRPDPELWEGDYKKRKS